MAHMKKTLITCTMLLFSLFSFAQPGGDMGGGFPPMGGMGQMGMSQYSHKTNNEGIDLSNMSLINDEQASKLIEQLKKKIAKHNKVLLSKFDSDKDGTLNKKELKAWKAWLEEEGEQPSRSDMMGNNDMGMNDMRNARPDSLNRRSEFGPHPNQEQGMTESDMSPQGNKNMSDKPSIISTAISNLLKASTINNKTLISDKANESVIRINKDATLKGEDLCLKKTGGDTTSADESNFFGLNAAIVVESDANGTLNGGSIYTNAEGANAVFAYGKNAKICIDNLNIETHKNSSRGLDATFGGSILGKNITITTQGAHCAALATDRGEGTVTVSNCNATTSGEGSPGIYSTGNISANNSIFYASGSEAAVIEGKNSITLDNCTLSGLKSCGIMLYQSFSGDARSGLSTLDMRNSKLTAHEGPMFFCTNTQTKIVLDNDQLIGHSGILLNAAANRRWGRQGSNGAQVTLQATNQSLDGSIIVDGISSANIYFGKGTTYTGAINSDNQSKQVNLTIEKGCKWLMTGDSFIQVLTASGQSEQEALGSIQTNGHKLSYTKVVATNK